MIIETPALVRRGRFPQMPISLSVLRIRANERIQGATIYISADGISYKILSNTRLSHFGGPLLDDLPADGPMLIEEGPTFTPLGPDIANVQDYSSDEANWKAGRQLVVFVNTVTGANEVCFLRNITAVDTDIVRLDGILRARFDCEMQEFPAGDTIAYISSPSRGKLLNDILITPGATLFVKVVPFARNSLPISDVDAQEITIRGKGVVPMNTSAPWVRAPYPMKPTYESGGGLTLGVMYRSVLALGTGSGAQGLGFPHGNAPVDGILVWRFRETDDTLVKEVTSTDPTLVVSNANLVEWFGSEPSAFDVGVVNGKAGFYSDEKKTRITLT